MNVAIIGSRGYTNYNKAKEFILANFVPGVHTFVSGGALGPDSFAEDIAREEGFSIIIHFPRWKEGKGAGYKRNHKIIDDADILVALWDGASKGTAHSIELAKKKGISIYIIEDK